MVSRESIRFKSNAEHCHGWFYSAKGMGAMPCIVMAHGFCSTKKMRLDAYAERLSDAGYHVLCFDYRHFGDSEGHPRQILDIKKQLEDWASALMYVRSLSCVNKQKLVLWGTSFSGGHVVRVAHMDKKVAAVISQVPYMNGVSVALAGGVIPNIKLSVAALYDSGRSMLGMTPYYLAATGRPGELAAMTAPGESESFRRLAPIGERIDENVAARIFLSLVRYAPGRFASKLRMPWLVQVALQDKTTPPTPAIVAAKKARKGKLITYDIGHFDVYIEPHFEITIKDQISFLKECI